jgi:glycosyltransferase involved in cell wall biosynthesis
MSSGLTFSTIIPAYNRSALIRRAITNCLLQDHPAFEVIVVDDGSPDGTAMRVSEIGDCRVRLFVQPVNRGVSPARNLAAERARGEWIVCLDSDDELTTDALALMEADIQRASTDVGGFRFMCRLDDGSLSPAPPLPREVWDYDAYLRWADEGTRGAARETLTCFRRTTFDVVRYPGAGAALSFGLRRALPDRNEPCRRASLPQ